MHMTEKDFITRMLEACKAAERKGLRFNRAVALAQAALESGWGGTALAREANNFFGIKAGPDWVGETLDLPAGEYSPETGWYSTIVRWRKYRDWLDCLIDYAGLIAASPWFRGALGHLDDAEGFLAALLPGPGKLGWATDPAYADKVRACGLTVERLGGPAWMPPDPAAVS